jgi:hypothetical protein
MGQELCTCGTTQVGVVVLETLLGLSLQHNSVRDRMDCVGNPETMLRLRIGH